MSFSDNIYICDSVNIVKKYYLFSHESVKKKPSRIKYISESNNKMNEAKWSGLRESPTLSPISICWLHFKRYNCKSQCVTLHYIRIHEEITQAIKVL